MSIAFQLEWKRNYWYIINVIHTDKYCENAVTTDVLIDAGIELMRQNIRRRHPAESEARIDILLGAWMHRADDPIPGDTSGQVRVRERIP